MVAAYHLIWAIYGAWLPNDPRGSSSTEVRSPVLEELGEIHYGRKRIQPCSSVIRRFYDAAKQLLKHDIIRFSDDDIATIADSSASTIKTRRYSCYGCAIMPDAGSYSHDHSQTSRSGGRHDRISARRQLEGADRNRTLACRSSHLGRPWMEGIPQFDQRHRAYHSIRGRQPAQSGTLRAVLAFVLVYDGWMPGVGARRKQK